jgi:hypothetical protein
VAFTGAAGAGAWAETVAAAAIAAIPHKAEARIIRMLITLMSPSLAVTSVEVRDYHLG